MLRNACACEADQTLTEFVAKIINKLLSFTGISIHTELLSKQVIRNFYLLKIIAGWYLKMHLFFKKGFGVAEEHISTLENSVSN